jgi:HSP20 family protein
MAGENKTQAGGQTDQQKQSGAGGLSRQSQRPMGGLWQGAGMTPFSMFRRWVDDMDRIFENFGMGRGEMFPEVGGALMRGGQGMWSPQIDVFNRNGQFVVRADLPGMTRNDVKVEISDEAITLQGERRFEHEENKEGLYRAERSYGSFYRTIPLPQGVSGEGATATFNSGVLEIALKAPQQQGKSRRVEIQEGAGTGPKSVH